MNCFECLRKVSGKSVKIFAAGVLFGTAGLKVLSSQDSKKVYAKCTAAVLRAKDCVMDTAAKVQVAAEDVYAEAQQINTDRAAAAEELEDEELDESDLVKPEEAAEA